jgi:RecA/RadA recombinase
VLRVELPASLAELAGRHRPHVLASDDLLALDPALAELLGAPGLRRGATVVVEGAAASGATTLALALLAAASAEGAWVAVVDLPRLGLLAAGELGLAVDRVVLVPDSGARFATVVGAMLDACDAVLVGDPGRLEPALARRLVTRARERRAVLVLVTPTAGPSATHPAPARGWTEGVDARLEVTAARRGGLGWSGLGEGCGHLSARLVEVSASRRRAAPPRLSLRLWLPSPDGTVAVASPAVADTAHDAAPGRRAGADRAR